MNEKETIIENLKQKAGESWSGKIGEERAKTLERFLRKMLTQYAQVLGYDETDILKALEQRRDYSCLGYYQEANFPTIDKDVQVFENKEAVRQKFPSGKFTCPACEGISTDPTECNSRKKMKEGKICDWKAYGLFGCMGKGYRFIIKDEFLKHPVVHEIFRPVELEVAQTAK